MQLKSEPISYCPTCRQVLNTEGKQITINNMRLELEKAFETKQKLDTEFMDLKSKHAIERCKLHSLEEKTDKVKEKHIKELQEQVKLLEQEQLEVERYNNTILGRKQTADGAKNDISIFNNQIVEYNKLLDNIKKSKEVAQKLYINYIEEKMKFATKHLKMLVLNIIKFQKMMVLLRRILLFYTMVTN